MKKFSLLLLIFLMPAIYGCPDTTSYSKGVYMLIDTSGTYKNEIDKAKNIINFLLAKLGAGDSFAVARVDSGSFSEKDIISKVTFDRRPSVANKQKRLFLQSVENFVKTAKGSPHTDITGGILQAIDYLNETKSGKKYILIFSDMEEDLKKGHIRDIPFSMENVEVKALNVTKLLSDNIDPREYYQRLSEWEKRVLDGKGTWEIINDLDHLKTIFQEAE